LVEIVNTLIYFAAAYLFTQGSVAEAVHAQIFFSGF
jgi:hypothetical protein